MGLIQQFTRPLVSVLALSSDGGHSGNNPDPDDANTLLTEGGDTLVTESGEKLVIE